MTALIVPRLVTDDRYEGSRLGKALKVGNTVGCIATFGNEAWGGEEAMRKQRLTAYASGSVY